MLPYIGLQPTKWQTHKNESQKIAQAYANSNLVLETSCPTGRPDRFGHAPVELALLHFSYRDRSASTASDHQRKLNNISDRSARPVRIFQRATVGKTASDPVASVGRSVLSVSLKPVGPTGRSDRSGAYCNPSWPDWFRPVPALKLIHRYSDTRSDRSARPVCPTGRPDRSILGSGPTFWPGSLQCSSSIFFDLFPDLLQCNPMQYQ